jgi:WD40 repeat protein
LQIRELSGHSGEVRSLIQLKDGLLASGSCDTTIMIWNCTNGLLVKLLKVNDDCVHDLIQFNDETLTSSGFATIKFWNLKSYSRVKTLTVISNGGISSLLLLNTLNIAGGLWDGTIVIWHLKSEKVVNYLYGHINKVASLVYLDKLYLASASRDGSIKIWNYETGDEIRTIKTRSSEVASIVLLKNDLLASAYWDKSIQIWNHTSGHLITTYNGHDDSVISLCLLKNGYLASASYDGYIRMWRVINEMRISSRNLNY